MAGSAWTNQVQNQVIVAGPGSGIFVYAGTPALGNLIASISSAPGTDPYGNTYPGGILGELETNEIQFLSGSTVVGQLGPVGGGAVPPLTLLNEPFASTAGTAANPSLITTDTWHNAAPAGGWSGTVQYQLRPDGTVALRTVGSLAAGTLTNGTVLFTLTGAYVASVAGQAIPVIISAVGAGTAATGVSPYLLIGTDGTAEVFGLVTQAATNIRFAGSYSLT